MLQKCYFKEREWERRQAYLIRTLFQDSPRQSIEPEEEESLVSYIARSAMSTFSSTEDQPGSPCSPLPELIIEVEPNKHDEPEEYYQKFEKKIMKIYKKMFIEGCSDVSDVSDSDSTSMSIQSIPNVEHSDRRASFGIVDDENIYLQTDAQDLRRNETQENDWKKKDAESNFKSNKCNRSNKENLTEENKSHSSDFLAINAIDDLKTTESKKLNVTNSSERSFDSDEPCLIEKETKIIGSEVVQRSTNTHYFSSIEDAAEKTAISESSDCDISYRQVTFQAEIHRDATDENVQTATSPIYELNNEEIIADNNFDDVNNDGGDKAELKKNNISGKNCSDPMDDSESVESYAIEVMRTPRIWASIGSLQNRPSEHSKCSVNQVNEKANELKSHTESESSNELVSNIMNYEESIDYDILDTSPIQSETYYERTATTRKRKTSLSPSLSAKTMKYEDVSVQTDPGNQDLNRRILCDSIFVGIPRVLKLCSCTNHFCPC